MIRSRLLAGQGTSNHFEGVLLIHTRGRRGLILGLKVGYKLLEPPSSLGFTEVMQGFAHQPYPLTNFEQPRTIET